MASFIEDVRLVIEKNSLSNSFIAFFVMLSWVSSKNEMPGTRMTRMFVGQKAKNCWRGKIIANFVAKVWGMITITADYCEVLLVAGNGALFARQAEQSNTEQSLAVPPDQLGALLAPIAVYPAPLLSQTVVAPTYPLEIVQLQQWL